MSRFRQVVMLALVAPAVASLAIRSASGHGEVIRLGAPAVAAGDSLAVTGEEWGEGAGITLALEGPTGTTELGTLEADADGRFETRVWIPADTPPGAYRVVATAGEERGTADLLVTASRGPADAGSSHGLHSAEEATADELDLDRRRSPLETGLAWGGVALLLTWGGFLVRRSRAS